MNFGILYGQTPGTFAYEQNIREDEAYKIYRDYELAHPKLMLYLKNTGLDAQKHYRAFTLPPYNRWRRLTAPQDWRRRNQGFNAPIQGASADMIKRAQVLCQRRIDSGFPARMLLSIHDQLLSETTKPKKWKKIKTRCLKQAAQEILKHDLMGVDIFITDRWIK
jgi:DNA polymerase I-like protein with 3'-5' exonuclease and polymerase domains